MLGLWLLVSAAAAMAQEDDGINVYKQTCANCHAVGIPGPAPKLGVRADWDSRLMAGRPTMLHSVLYGKGAMPPKGGNASITDTQASAALDYMLMKLGNTNSVQNMPAMPNMPAIPNMPAMPNMPAVPNMRR